MKVPTTGNVMLPSSWTGARCLSSGTPDTEISTRSPPCKRYSARAGFSEQHSAATSRPVLKEVIERRRHITAGKKIMDQISGSNGFTVLKLNHAEYYSLEPFGVLLLIRRGFVGDASLLRCRHEAFWSAGLPRDAYRHASRTRFNFLRVLKQI